MGLDPDLALRWLHILGACVLIGTGSGIAFFMLLAWRDGRPAVVAQTAASVVIADWIFTASAAVLQPITGGLLAWRIGWTLADGWLLTSIGLYVFIGALWLPVVAMQRRMRDLARAAELAGGPLPPACHRLFRLWFWSGVPAFLAILVLLWMMVARPGF